jgi:hypothetical protein
MGSSKKQEQESQYADATPSLHEPARSSKLKHSKSKEPSIYRNTNMRHPDRKGRDQFPVEAPKCRENGMGQAEMQQF